MRNRETGLKVITANPARGTRPPWRASGTFWRTDRGTLRRLPVVADFYYVRHIRSRRGLALIPTRAGPPPWVLPGSGWPRVQSRFIAVAMNGRLAARSGTLAPWRDSLFVSRRWKPRTDKFAILSYLRVSCRICRLITRKRPLLGLSVAWRSSWNQFQVSGNDDGDSRTPRNISPSIERDDAILSAIPESSRILESSNPRILESISSRSADWSLCPSRASM